MGAQKTSADLRKELDLIGLSSPASLRAFLRQVLDRMVEIEDVLADEIIRVDEIIRRG